MPKDGQADPIGVTNVLAKAAKIEGVKSFEKSPVKKILVKNKKICGVETDKRKIACDYVSLNYPFSDENGSALNKPTALQFPSRFML